MADDVVIRAATRDDIGGIVEMAQKFYATTDYASLCQMDDAQAAGLAILLIDTGIMLVAEHEGELVGMAGLHVEPFTFYPSILMATEVVFWINEESRGKGLASLMLDAAEDAAKSLGCSVIRMQALRNSGPIVADFYGKRGYDITEIIHTRRLR